MIVVVVVKRRSVPKYSSMTRKHAGLPTAKPMLMPKENR
jgi:hypothetical protein